MKRYKIIYLDNQNDENVVYINAANIEDAKYKTMNTYNNCIKFINIELA